MRQSPLLFSVSRRDIHATAFSSEFMDSQSQDDSLGVVSPGDIPKSQVVSTGHSMETGKAGATGLSEDQTIPPSSINNDPEAGGSLPAEKVSPPPVLVSSQSMSELEKLCGGIGGDYDELSYYGTYLINICLVVTY